VCAAGKRPEHGASNTSPTSCDQVGTLSSSPAIFEAWLQGCFDCGVMHETLILRVGVADRLLQIFNLRFLDELDSLAQHIVACRHIPHCGFDVLVASQLCQNEHTDALRCQTCEESLAATVA
jgi:hypothetical protein